MSQTTSLPRDLDWNGAFLRDLARSLLRDPADAEDIGQEAWVASWRYQKKHGPLDPERAPGWLATVLRRRRGTLLRSGERRRQREAIAARPEPLPSVADTAARIEVAETLLGLVRDLDEPVRTAIIARYYDGLGVEAIGRRESTPASTIRSRIERGLLQLREQLDRRDPEGRAGWMSALSGFAAQQVGQSGGTVAGGIAPWMGLTVAGALAAGAAVVWLVPALEGREPASPAEIAKVALVQDEPVAVTGDSSSSLAPLPAEVAREQAPILEQEPDVATPAAPNRWGRVVNALPNGQVEAASDVVVRWEASAKTPPTLQGIGYLDSSLGSMGYGGAAPAAPSPGGPNVANTAADGRYRWRAEPSGEAFLVLVEGDALYQDIRWEGAAAEWDALPRPLEWRRERHLTVRGRVEDLAGQPLPEVSIRATGKSGAIEREAESDEEGRFSFMDPGPGGLVKAERPGWIMCSAEELRKLTQEGAVGPTIVMARAGRLEVRLAGDSSGIESAGAQVSLAEVPLNGPLATEGVEADVGDDQVAVLERLPVGQALVVRTGSLRGYTHMIGSGEGEYLAVLEPLDDEAPLLHGAIPIVIPESGLLRLRVEDSHHRVLRGVVLDAEGAPVPEAALMLAAEWRREQGASTVIEHVESNELGQFELGFQHAGKLRPVLLVASAPEQRGARWPRNRTRPASAAIEIHGALLRSTPSFKLRLGKRPEAQVEVTLPRGSMKRVLIEFVGMGSDGTSPLVRSRAKPDESGFASARLLLAGRYRVVARHPLFEDVSQEVELPSPAPIPVRFTTLSKDSD